MTQDDNRRVGSVVTILLQFLDRLSSGEGNKRPLFNTGEKIKATYRGGTKLYAAKILARNADGTYDILYNDNDTDHAAREENMRNPDGSVREARVSNDDRSTFNHPHVYLASNKSNFDLFFKLLGFGGEAGPVVWTVLNRLPTNVDLKNRVKNLVDETEVDWKTVLPDESLIKLLYMLQIVEKNAIVSIVEEEDGDEAGPPLARASSTEHPPRMQEWCQMFINTHGLDHIISVFENVEVKDCLQNDLSIHCVALILKIIDHFLTGNTNSIGVEGQTIFASLNSANLMNKLLPMLRSALVSEAKTQALAGALGGLVNYILLTIQALVRANSSLLASVFSFDHWNEILGGLITNHSEPVRQSLASALVEMCSDASAEHANMQTPLSFFTPLLLEQLGNIDTSSEEKYCTELLSTLGELLQRSDGSSSQVDVASLAQTLTSLIQRHPFREASEKDHDPVQCSLLNLVSSLLQRNPSLKNLLGVQGDSDGKESLLKTITRCLFDLPSTNFSSENTAPPPKCKSSHSRNAAFSVLNEMCKDCPANFHSAVNFLMKNHLVTHSGGMGSVKDPRTWTFEAKAATEESRQDYVGLVNLGCICYMNAANQQFFMIPKLRQNVLAIDEMDDPDPEKSMIYNFQYVMGYLQESGQQAINPKPWCNVWTDEFGDPINVGKQEDSHGYVNRLIDRFSEQLRNTRHKDAFTQVFGGTLQHQIIGLGDCKHMKYREEPFSNISVEIKQKKNLLESLTSYIQGENLDSYRCDCCGKKVAISKRAVISKLPLTLILQLKRFELDFNTFQSVKVNDRLEFPMELDMKPYTAEHLTSPEQLQRLADTKVLLDEIDAREALKAAKASEGEGKDKSADEGKDKASESVADEAKEKTAPEAVRHPAEYYKYKLKGVVVHTGTVNAGHYYSFIQERLPDHPEDEKWYKFNDASVTEFDVANLPDETFGGSKGPQSWGGAANGYLLFYDRVAPAKTVDTSAIGDKIGFETATQVLRFANKMSKVKKAHRARVAVPPKIFHEIWEKNLTYWRDRNVFDNSYFEFLWDFVSAGERFAAGDVKLSEVDMNTPSHPRDAVTRLATRFYMVTLCHAKNKRSINQWAGVLKRLYAGNVASCAWLLNKFTDMRSIWAFNGLFNNPFPRCRQIVADLLTIALSVVSPLEQASYGMERSAVEVDSDRPLIGADVRMDSRGFCVGFGDLLVTKMMRFATQIKNWESYWRVVNSFANLGACEKAYISRGDLVSKLIDVYLGPLSPHPEVNNDHGASAQSGTRIKRSASDCTTLFELISTMMGGSLNGLSEIGQEMITSKAFLQSFLAEGTRFKSSVGVCRIAVELCADLKLCQTLVDSIGESMLTKTHDAIRPFFRPIQAILAVEDDLQTERVHMVMEGLISVMDKQKTFWKVFDLMADHIIRLAKKNAHVLQWLNSTERGEQATGWMKRYFGLYPEPPTNNLNPRLKLDNSVARGYQYMQTRGTSVMFTQSSPLAAYHLTVPQKIEALTAILSNPSALGTDDASDSDKANEERKLNNGDQIDVLDEQNNWLACTVVGIKTGGNVRIHYNGYKSTFDEDIHQTSNRIAPVGRFSSLKKRSYAATARGM